MRVAFGSVQDRAWGLTIGTIGQRRLTGQLDLRSDDKLYSLAFAEGTVTAATSPLASDSIARIALTGHLISSSQIGDLTRRLAAAPDRDEVEVVAEAAKLRPEHVASLRHRITMQRAARTFAIDRGEFTIEDQVSLRVVPGLDVSHVPLGAVIYHGVRMNLSEQRLAEDLREIGTSFMLRRTVTPDELASYGFGAEATGVLEALRDGTTLAELEAKQREVESRALQAIVYALVSCGACDATGGKPVDRTAPPVARTSTGQVPRTITPRTITPRTISGSVGSRTTTGQRITTSEPLVGRAPTRSGNFASRSPDDLPARQSPTPPTGISIKRSSTPTAPGGIMTDRTPMPSMARTITTPRTITARERAARDVEALLATRIAMLDRGADYFSVLGVIPEAPPEAIRAAYFSMSRQLHKDSLVELGITDEGGGAVRVLAQLQSAFTVLCDPQRRREYIDALNRGEATPLAPRARTGELDRAELAQEAFARGETALRREQLGDAVSELARAVELDGANVDYAAVLAWAQFCAAPDKQAVALETRRTLANTIHKSHHPVVARFYLGRVERMLGRLREALAHFQEVMDIQPGHAEAASEIRFIESRLSNPGFTRSTRKR